MAPLGRVLSILQAALLACTLVHASPGDAAAAEGAQRQAAAATGAATAAAMKSFGCICMGIGEGFAWTDRVRQARAEMAQGPPACGEGARVCGLSVDACRGRQGKDLLRAANAFWNARVPWRSDAGTWETADRWAPPWDFAARGGDCEDFALAKLWTLKELGWPEDRLWLVAFASKGPGKTVDHVLLAAELDGRLWILDHGAGVYPAEVASGRRGTPVLAASADRGWTMLSKKAPARRTGRDGAGRRSRHRPLAGPDGIGFRD